MTEAIKHTVPNVVAAYSEMLQLSSEDQIDFKTFNKLQKNYTNMYSFLRKEVNSIVIYDYQFMISEHILALTIRNIV